MRTLPSAAAGFDAGRHPWAEDGKVTVRDLSVAVIGGGIGGLAAALSLLDAGIDAHVYEQAADLREVGAGIQVAPNASRILHRIGLAPALAQIGVRPGHWHQRRWDDGRTLLRTDLGGAAVAAFGAPYYHVHRADLLAALAAWQSQEGVRAEAEAAAPPPSPVRPSLFEVRKALAAPDAATLEPALAALAVLADDDAGLDDAAALIAVVGGKEILGHADGAVRAAPRE